MSEYSGRKSYKYKLDPTPVQEQAMETTLWRCRTLYNCALEQRKTWWERGEGKSPTRFQQEAELKAIRAEMPEYDALHSHVLQDVLARLDNGFLVVSKIGRIAIRLHRPLLGTPKAVTISREADGWYAIISCAGVPMQPLPPTGCETGIDVGLKVFLVTAHGLVIENPRHFRKSERCIAKADKHVARCKKGTKGRRKALARRAKAYQHVKRQRADFHHKVALQLLRDNDTIYLEDLQVANMVRNRHLAKSISDAAWGQFRAILSCKAEWAGKRVIAVPAQYTSQDCSGCGERVPKSLSVRTHVCPACGLVLDRDENAAIHILRAGQAR